MLQMSERHLPPLPSQQLLIPVLIGVVMARGVSGILCKSIYDQILVLKGLPYMPHLRTQVMFELKAESIMRPTHAALERGRAAAVKQADEMSKMQQGEAMNGGVGVDEGGVGEGVDELEHTLPASNPYCAGVSEYDQALPVIGYDMTVREVNLAPSHLPCASTILSLYLLYLPGPNTSHPSEYTPPPTYTFFTLLRVQVLCLHS